MKSITYMKIKRTFASTNLNRVKKKKKDFGNSKIRKHRTY